MRAAARLRRSARTRRCCACAVLWACILVPQLALDAVLRRLPDPDPPLALVEGPAQLRSLHAVNAAAAGAGLKPGMRLSAAHALLADVRTVDYDPQAEAHWHRFLAAWAYRHSSMVTMQWANAIVLEARASFRLFGPWPRFERRLRRRKADAEPVLVGEGWDEAFAELIVDVVKDRVRQAERCPAAGV